MPTSRVPIWKLLTLVAVFGVAVAALRNPTVLTAGCVFSLTVGVLLFALVGTIARQGNGRLPWLGFVTFGTGYLVLAFIAENTHFLPKLPSISLMDALSNLFPVAESSLLLNLSTNKKETFWTEERVKFYQIGHCFIALLVGLVGSLLARMFRTSYDGTQPPGRRKETP